MTMVELRLPADLMAALPEEQGTERGLSDIGITLDVVGAVSNIVSLAGVLKAAPELARRLRAWIRGRPADAGPVRLTIKGPGIALELDLPPNISSEKIADAVTRALQPGPTE